ncbi:MAG: UDP-N-acetylmuramoyl-tripeptide--D-alanyl-D-alanine ligase [Proteobacteria bacterium]|nr:UDP-N-acetylmuramoyl-tripeptide--D-alanyl-D-alanine ligase [Pseudomonadota bacterium]
MTARAKRILGMFMLDALLVGVALFLIITAIVHSPDEYLGWYDVPIIWLAWSLLLLQLPPFLLVLANWMLGPLESSIRRKYRMAAVAKLKALRPMVIGITGSYGKTSTKHFLAHILSSAESTLTTPGSVNTEMGIVRVIREHLEPRDKYFIVEMGAYGIGSIRRLCALTPPRLGIITGVGMAHYERFQSLDNVMAAKFELAEAVHEAGGKTIVNAGAMPAALLAARQTGPGELVLCGKSGEEAGEEAAPPAIALTKVEETRRGLEMTLVVNVVNGAEGTGEGSTEEGREEFTLTAPVWGVHQAENIMLAVAAALELGFPMATIQAALSTLKQVRHRLEVTRSKTGPWVIDDAYNSNPVGFAAALQTLNTLSREGGRRVLITPGMVELGAEHAKQHRELGWEAGRVVDLALVVTAKRIPTFIEGFEESMSEWAELKTFATQQQAEDWYKANANDKDVVLFENNLPDLFEAKLRF